MHINPAVEILRSKDSVNRGLVRYCMERCDLGPAIRLETKPTNQHLYDKGRQTAESWIGRPDGGEMPL